MIIEEIFIKEEKSDFFLFQKSFTLHNIFPTFLLSHFPFLVYPLFPLTFSLFLPLSTLSSSFPLVFSPPLSFFPFPLFPFLFSPTFLSLNWSSSSSSFESLCPLSSLDYQVRKISPEILPDRSLSLNFKLLSSVIKI